MIGLRPSTKGYWYTSTKGYDPAKTDQILSTYGAIPVPPDSLDFGWSTHQRTGYFRPALDMVCHPNTSLVATLLKAYPYWSQHDASPLGLPRVMVSGNSLHVYWDIELPNRLWVDFLDWAHANIPGADLNWIRFARKQGYGVLLVTGTTKPLPWVRDFV